MTGDWYTPEEYPILDVDELDGALHLLVAKRPAGVRFSAGCLAVVDPVERARMVAEPVLLARAMGLPL